MPLSPGDIAFTYVNGVDTEQEFKFVALTDIAAGEQISFTDHGWRTDTNGFTVHPGSGEGYITWTAPVGGLPAGTVVSFKDPFVAGGGRGVSHGSGTVIEERMQFGNGDQLIAFTGSFANPTPIAALNLSSDGWLSTMTTDEELGSALPAGLVEGTTAVAIDDGTNGASYGFSFVGPYSQSDWLGRFNDWLDWDTQDAGSISFHYSGPANINVDCFAAGTLIATPTGETPVEGLLIGDLVTTADGRAVPVKWIGRQTVHKRFAGERAQLVRIEAGALGNHSDLYVTGDHGMVLDGFVVNASALVNGRSIDWVSMADTPEVQTVYHVETETHDVILAGGAASESYLDVPGRQAFDNYREYLDLYGEDRALAENPMPRITAARMLPARLRGRLAA